MKNKRVALAGKSLTIKGMNYIVYADSTVYRKARSGLRRVTNIMEKNEVIREFNRRFDREELKDAAKAAKRGSNIDRMMGSLPINRS